MFISISIFTHCVVPSFDHISSVWVGRQNWLSVSNNLCSKYIPSLQIDKLSATHRDGEHVLAFTAVGLCGAPGAKDGERVEVKP